MQLSAYFSPKLDPVVAGLPLCLQAMASAEKAVVASSDIMGYGDWTLVVSVAHILHSQETSHLSALP